jgi:hypothetical protein
MTHFSSPFGELFFKNAINEEIKKDSASTKDVL